MSEFDIDVKFSDYVYIPLSYYLISEACEESLRSEGFKQILNYSDNFKFDLVIYDYSHLPCTLAILPKFNFPPLIGISAFSNPPFTADIVGGDRLGMTVKPYFSFEYDPENMSIFQRLNNGIINFLDSM